MCVGVRIADNCYGITPSISNKCFSTKINQVDLWNQRLVHASHKQLEKISKCDAVIGLPKFEKIEKCICGPCQIKKTSFSSTPAFESDRFRFEKNQENYENSISIGRSGLSVRSF